MTINEAYQAMQNGKKVTHRKIDSEIDYLQLVIMPDIIDDCANNRQKYFDSLKTNPIFKTGWELTDIK